jgi:hypothetical protein
MAAKLAEGWDSNQGNFSFRVRKVAPPPLQSGEKPCYWIVSKWQRRYSQLGGDLIKVFIL